MLGIHVHFSNPMEDIVHNAVSNRLQSFQIFVRSNRNYRGQRAIPQNEIDAFNTALLNSNISQFVVHASYLMNPCIADLDKRIKYAEMVVDDLQLMNKLAGDKYYVLHPGSAKEQSEESSLQNLFDFIRNIAPYLGDTKLAVEIMAGSGTQVLSNPYQLACFYREFEKDDNIGFCFDTCHVFASGMNVLNLYDSIKEKVKVIHLNNSFAVAGSHVDRHAPVYDGRIPNEIIREFCNKCSKDVPIILETPYETLLSDYEAIKEILNKEN